MARKKEPESPEERANKHARTLIVKRHKDANIKDSKAIRRVINREFSGEVIRNARTTVGGSLLIELDDKETADRIKEGWKNNLFGGNEGVVKIANNPPAGIIKEVYSDKDTDDDDIIRDIKQKYPNCEVDMFQKNGKFSGTIKIIF